MRRILISICLILLSQLPPCFAEQDPLSLQTLAGDSVGLSEFAGDGRWLLVMIWATDCSVCSQEMPRISDFHVRHAANDASVLGISIDGYEKRKAVAGFIEQNSLTFPNLIAQMPTFALRYEFEVGEKLLGTPTYLLFNPSGELVANNPGPVRPKAVEQFMAR